jgi:EAL and modified HD-GYP domain-containing signal transduction protein
LNEHPILGHVVLGYSPMIDKNRTVVATRLTVFPAKPDTAVDAGALLAAVADVWPAEGGRVSLNIVSESLLRDLMDAEPATNLMIEVPAFMAADPANTAALQQLHKHGNTLLIKGRPVRELPREVLPCFKHSIIDVDEERRDDDSPAAGVVRSITHVQGGVRTLAQLDASFKRGAIAVLGWPLDDAIEMSGGKAAASRPDLQTIVELIRRVDKEEPVERIEATLKLDPTLAFKLMRYINSPAFGLSVEISSFRHAVMMLGYHRLKRWLALLLASASKDADMKPVMFAAVRRGLLMEELVRGTGDQDMRNEAFICGVFSLLDRMMRQPFDELLKTIPVPDAVFQALVHNTGPFQPYFEVVRAVEQESLFDIRESADRLMVSVAEINRAELRALANAAQLE